MSNQVLQKEISALEAEIRDLKIACRIPSKLKVYTYGPEVPPSLEIEIVYGEGEQPIIAEIYYGGTAMAEEPVGNTQRVHLFAMDAYEVFIASTRPILSVRAV